MCSSATELDQTQLLIKEVTFKMLLNIEFSQASNNIPTCV